MKSAFESVDSVKQLAVPSVGKWATSNLLRALMEEKGRGNKNSVPLA